MDQPEMLYCPNASKVGDGRLHVGKRRGSEWGRGWRTRFPTIDGPPDLSKAIHFVPASGGYVVHTRRRWSPERATVATLPAWRFATGSRYSSSMPAPALCHWVMS